MSLTAEMMGAHLPDCTKRQQWARWHSASSWSFRQASPTPAQQSCTSDQACHLWQTYAQQAMHCWQLIQPCQK